MMRNRIYNLIVSLLLVPSLVYGWTVYNDGTPAAATTGTAGLMSATDKAKLDGVATGATAESYMVDNTRNTGGTGGTITEVSLSTGIERVHTFTSSGTFVVPSGVTSVQYLVVAGGGGGGSGIAGGGGAGGFRTGNLTVATGGAYAITVGGGGTGGVGASISGTNGSNSVFSTIIATGGGGGGAGATTGIAGGSGGGVRTNSSGGLGNTPTTSPSQGNNGGAGGATNGTASGGGGSGAVGGNVVGSAGGAGGAGTASTISGTSVTYAGGGGGGGYVQGPTTAGAGGTGGGGAGGVDAAGTAGATNSGSAGGGGGYSNVVPTSYSGGNGGSGIVIVRYLYKAVDTPIYVNNAAAISGGLDVGDIYRSGDNPDTLRVVSTTLEAVITASRALVSDANSKITASSITSTTLGYLDATSSVQTQINSKSPIASPVFTGVAAVGVSSPDIFTVTNPGVNGVGIQLRGEDGTAGALNYSVGRLYGDFVSGSGNYTDSRIRLQTPSAENVWVDGLTVKNGSVGIGTLTPTSKLQVVGLPTYADNTAALAGGLTAGAFYRTSTGVLMVAY